MHHDGMETGGGEVTVMGLQILADQRSELTSDGRRLLAVDGQSSQPPGGSTGRDFSRTSSLT